MSFKERFEFTDGKLLWTFGKTLKMEVAKLGRMKELQMTIDGRYVGMDEKEARRVRNMLNRGIKALKDFK